MANTILVVDMLRGFLEEGNPLYIGELCRSIIPDVKLLLSDETTKGSNIIFLCDNHASDDLEFDMFPPHCIEGSPECEIIPELTEFADTIIPKQRYSGFFNTPLESILLEQQPEKLIVCGVLTDICVMHTVADARNRDYPVDVPVSCVATPDPDSQRFALYHMVKVLGANLI